MLSAGKYSCEVFSTKGNKLVEVKGTGIPRGCSGSNSTGGAKMLVTEVEMSLKDEFTIQDSPTSPSERRASPPAGMRILGSLVEALTLRGPKELWDLNAQSSPKKIFENQSPILLFKPYVRLPKWRQQSRIHLPAQET